MKRFFATLLLLALIFNSSIVFADNKEDYDEIVTFDNETNQYSYNKVIAVNDGKKEVMFKKAKDWVIANLKTADNNVGHNETDFSIVNTGTLIIDNRTAFTWAVVNTVVNFKLNIKFKDGKYKILVNQIIVVTPVNTIPYDKKVLSRDKAGKYCMQQVNEKIKAFVTALDKAIQSKSDSEKW